jgi:hypothetical protein
MNIHDVIKKGDLEQVEALLKDNPDLVCSKDNNDWTPLHLAVVKGRKDVADLLLVKGADVNAKNNKGETPLCYAADSGRKEVAELLIVNKADVNAKDGNGWTPLHYATYQGYCDVAELLMANRAEVNAVNNSNETPLRMANLKGHQAVAELLRRYGAHSSSKSFSPNAQNSSNTSSDTIEYLEQLPPAHIMKWRKAKYTMLVIGLVLLVVIPPIAYFLVPSAAHSVDRSVDRTVHKFAQGGNDPSGKLVNTIDTGWSVFGFFVILALAGGGVLFGIVLTSYSTICLLVGPAKAAKKPHASVRQFYNHLLDDSHLFGDEVPSRLAAYVCLSATARENVGFLEGLCQHWAFVRKQIKGAKMYLGATAEPPKIYNAEETTADYEVVIKCTTSDRINSQNVNVSRHRYKVSGKLIRVGRRWYLKDGNWSGALLMHGES